MTCTVYYWPQNLLGRSVGHASILIDMPHRKQYVSWFPSKKETAYQHGKAALLGTDAVLHTIEDDFPKDAKTSPLSVLIQGLDELGMIDSWDKSASRRYSLLGDNCAQTVANVLRSGGGEKVLGTWQKYITHRQWTYWSPKDSYDFAVDVEKALRKRR